MATLKPIKLYENNDCTVKFTLAATNDPAFTLVGKKVEIVLKKYATDLDADALLVEDSDGDTVEITGQLTCQWLVDGPKTVLPRPTYWYHLDVLEGLDRVTAMYGPVNLEAI